MSLTHAEYRRTRYFPALDGLRAISILLVLVLHTNSQIWKAANGALGVFIFYVISGYLITTLSLREESERGSISLRAFYVRRACRIFPLYYLILLVYVVLVIGADYHGHRSLLLQAMPYYLTYLNDFAPELPSMPYAHSWSLGVEEKFYMVWPVLAFGLWRGRFLMRFVGTAALVVLPPVLDALHLLPFDARRYGVPLYFSYGSILVGCLLAFALHHRRSFDWLSRFASGPWALLALAAGLLAHVFVWAGTWMMLVYPFAVAIAMVPILIGRVRLVGWLASRPMVFIGMRAYGIYLVHLICLSVVGNVVRRIPGVVLDHNRIPVGEHVWGVSLLMLALGCGASLLFATGLNIAVERPFIALGRRWSKALAGAEPVAPPRMEPAPADPPGAPPSQRA